MDRSSFESQLRHELHARGEHLPVRGRGPAAVRRTATRRRRRLQLTGVTVTVTLVGAATASVIATRDSGEQSVVNAGQPGVTDLAAATEAPFDWRVLDEHSAVGDSPAVITGSDGTLYVLSTAPGAQAPQADGSWEPAPQALYASTDGTTWTPRALTDLWIGSLAERDGVLYAVGTAPATAAVGGSVPVAATSSDHGVTWSQTPLPLAIGTTGPSGVKTSLGTLGLATGPAGVVAVASTWTDLDVASLLPAGALDDGYRTTADGVDVYGPVTDPAALAQACPTGWTAEALPPGDGTPAPAAAGDVVPDDPVAAVPVAVGAEIARKGARGTAVRCTSPDPGVAPLVSTAPFAVVAHHSWSELGVDPAAGAQVGRATAHLFVAPDGHTFAEVAAPFPGASDVQLLGTADGYVALAQSTVDTDPSNPTTALSAWRSADGATWTPVPAPALSDVDWVSAAGVVDGGLVVVDGGGRILRSTDGGTWTATDLAAALGADAPAGSSVQVGAAGVGPAGIVLTADVVAPATITPVTHDGLTLQVHGSTATIVDAATRAVVADGIAISQPSVTDGVRVDPYGGEIVVLDPATGAVRARFGYDEIKQAIVEQGSDPAAAVLVSSTDGVHVGVTPVSDLIGGATGYVSWIHVADRALVDVSRATDDGSQPGNRILLVGTPPR